MTSYDETKFNELVGQVLTKVEVKDDSIMFHTETGDKYIMYHSQDCCESVYIESIVGDLDDLIGDPIFIAEEVISNKTPTDFTHEYEPESQTWTFYKLATIKGHVDIRWFGSSNGYYSETVYFLKMSDLAKII